MRKQQKILWITVTILVLAIISGLIFVTYYFPKTDKVRIIQGSNESVETRLTLLGRVGPDTTLYNIILMGPPGCQPASDKINLDEATEFATYFDLETRLRFEVPYNPEWGAPYFIYQPYDEDLKDYPRTITFGKPSIDTCNGISSRKYRLEFAPAESKENLISRLEKEYADSDYLKINTLDIDDKTVVHVSTYTGPGGYTGAVVIGKKYNYILTGGIQPEVPLSGAPLEIIKSMKILD